MLRGSQKEWRVHITRYRTVLIAAVMGALVAALLTWRSSVSSPAHPAGVNSKASTAVRTQQLSGALRFSREHGPLLLGEPVSLAEAESRAGVHLPRPDTEVANDSDILAVFSEKRSKEEEETGSYLVAIDYGPGFVLYLHPASYDGKAADDPEKQYHLMADDLNAALGSIASVQTVQGVAALVIEQAPGGVASVDLVLPGGLRVQLIAEYAPTMKAAQLVEIAESLK